MKSVTNRINVELLNSPGPDRWTPPAFGESEKYGGFFQSADIICRKLDRVTWSVYGELVDLTE